LAEDVEALVTPMAEEAALDVAAEDEAVLSQAELKLSI
jgi:hypothetical protein